MKKIGEHISYDNARKNELKVEIIPVLTNQKSNILLLWGAAWSLCGLIIIISLFTYGFNKDEYIMVGVFLLFWGYFEFKVLHALRWNKTGKELLELKEGEFIYNKTLNGRGFPRVMEISKLRPFVYAEDTEKGFWSDINKSSWMVGGEVVEYGFEDSIKRLGMKIPKKDAIRLITLLNKTAGFNA